MPQLHDIIRAHIQAQGVNDVRAVYQMILRHAERRNRVLKPFAEYTCVVCEKCHLNEAVLHERHDQLTHLSFPGGWVSVTRWREVVIDHTPRSERSTTRVWVPAERKRFFPPGKCSCKE